MDTISRVSILLAAAMALLFSTFAISGNIYRWVDDKGVAHYGDRPDVGAEVVRVRNGKPVPPPNTQGKEQTEDELAEIRSNQCEKARKRYSQFESSDRIVETDAFGKKRELSAEERLTSIARAKGDIASYCGEEG